MNERCTKTSPCGCKMCFKILGPSQGKRSCRSEINSFRQGDFDVLATTCPAPRVMKTGRCQHAGLCVQRPSQCPGNEWGSITVIILEIPTSVSFLRLRSQGRGFRVQCEVCGRLGDRGIGPGLLGRSFYSCLEVTRDWSSLAAPGKLLEMQNHGPHL